MGQSLTDGTGIRWFRTAVDWWIAALLVALPVVELGGLIAALRSGEREAVTAMLAGCGIVAAIYGLLLIPIRYGVSREHLVIRFGVVRQRVALEQIHEVYPTRNPISSPALSLDRLAIRTGAGILAMNLISPSERDEFLAMLASNSGLHREGDRLVRRRADDGPT